MARNIKQGRRCFKLGYPKKVVFITRLPFTLALASVFILLAAANAGFIFQQVSEYFQAKVRTTFTLNVDYQLFKLLLYACRFRLHRRRYL